MSNLDLGHPYKGNLLEIRLDSSGVPILTISYEGKINFNSIDYPQLTAEDFAKEFVDIIENLIINVRPIQDNIHVSKLELREWCNEIIQKEVFRKTIRFPEDKVIADTKEKMVHRILDKFCGGEV